MTDASYPPAPWRLGGELFVSTFRVAPAVLPELAAPCGFRPLRVGGRAVVGVAFARYDGTGVLAYDELLVGVGGLWRGRPVSHIPQIWVDSERSVRGGRALWGIPKELAAFGAGDGIAAMRAKLGPPLLPGLRRVPLLTAQPGMVSTNLVLARVRAMRARWEFAPDGPLGWLHGRHPAVSVALTEATIVFGTRTTPTR